VGGWKSLAETVSPFRRISVAGACQNWWLTLLLKWSLANVGFSLCPILTAGAIEALLLVGSDVQKNRYLHKLIKGTWTGMLNLNGPQAASDLNAIRTRAVPGGCCIDRWNLPPCFCFARWRPTWAPDRLNPISNRALR
jgi:hypothetical protein